ncbi:hypothetical protein ACFP2T_45750 [Plantactinospora solaniradicis]|uniref:WXG100 family type VII secretion target n=1 Tax=Plantactinospora solaniradicis TaxID=1723736 RepID=A0ABW1KRW2_9ACTN
MAKDGAAAVKAWESADSKADKLVSAVNFQMKLPIYPKPVKERAATKMTEFHTKRATLTSELTPFLAQPGNTTALLGSHVGWQVIEDHFRHMVGQILADPELADDNALAVDDFWKGDAARSYQSILPLREQAVVGMAEAASALRNVVSESRNALDSFYNAVIGGLILYGIGAAGAIAAAAAGGPLAGAVAGISAVSAIAGLLVPAIIQIKSTMDDLKTQVGNLPAFNEHNRYPGGHWPELAR